MNDYVHIYKYVCVCVCVCVCVLVCVVVCVLCLRVCLPVYCVSSLNDDCTLACMMGKRKAIFIGERERERSSERAGKTHQRWADKEGLNERDQLRQRQKQTLRPTWT